MPTSPRNEREFRMLDYKARRAMLEGQFGSELPIELGTWSKDFYFRLVEQYPRHSFAFADGKIIYEGDPPQNVHASICAAFLKDVLIFASKTQPSVDHCLQYSGELVKVPDLTFSRTAASVPCTIVEVSWANESMDYFFRELRWATQSGLNAIGIKTWYDGKSGNAAVLPAIQLYEPYNIDLEHIISKITIIIVIQSSHSASPHVQCIGPAINIATHHQETSDDPIAWIPSGWFQHGVDLDIPLDIDALRWRMAMTLLQESFGNDHQHVQTEYDAHQSRLEAAITNSALITEQIRARLLSKVLNYFD